ncbi:MAG: class I SAM-dependent methyltransferase [Anaerolineaceae bacterium]|nr:class I SAM-dependent methyltransferase [Anaerolineaceae bacterium]
MAVPHRRGYGAGLLACRSKLCSPTCAWTLVRGQDGQFLQAVVDALALGRVTIVAERAELLGQMPQHRQQYDCQQRRAPLPSCTLVEFLLPLCRAGGAVLAQKGEGVHEELPNGQTAVPCWGAQPELAEVTCPEESSRIILSLSKRWGNARKKISSPSGNARNGG